MNINAFFIVKTALIKFDIFFCKDLTDFKDLLSSIVSICMKTKQRNNKALLFQSNNELYKINCTI